MSLQDRIDRWFIDTNQGGTYPPQTRHTNSLVKPHTTGNRVTPLIDGEAYFAEWATIIDAAINHATPTDCAVYHAGWLLDDLVIPSTGKPAYDYLTTAQKSGVEVNVALSDHSRPGLLDGQVGHVQNRGVLYNELSSVRGGVDDRFPVAGSMHIKSTVVTYPDQPAVALVGSTDIDQPRASVPGHANTSGYEELWHEVGLRIEGRATVDVLNMFVDCWNDSSRTSGFKKPILPIGSASTNLGYILSGSPDRITKTTSYVQDSSGPQAVQLLSTFARDGGYSWEAGEFTVWAAYLNAIRNAETYIYIEDQFFLPFGSPPDFACEERQQIRETSLFYELGRAIDRGVTVLVVVAAQATKGWRAKVRHNRRLGFYYLDDITQNTTTDGSFYVAAPRIKLGNNKTHWVLVHSKVMLVDDVVAFVGAANFNRRSMTHDTELQLAVLDADGSFTKDLRLSLWNEWLDGVTVDIDDPETGSKNMKHAMATDMGLLHGWLRETAHPEPDCGLLGGDSELEHFIDPYGGPDKDEVAE